MDDTDREPDCQVEKAEIAEPAEAVNRIGETVDQAQSEPEARPKPKKRNAATLDPASTVARYLRDNTIDSLSRLRLWRGTFWLWRAGCYRELPTSEVRARMVMRLNQRYARLTTAIVSNCLDQLRAQALLGSHVTAPAWLGDQRPPFPAVETLACPNGLLHLPGLIDGAEGHFRRPTPRFFSICALDFDFARDAREPERWLRFVRSLWPHDQQSIDTLQEWFGYSLLLDTSQQKILMLIGPRRSGKGTIARILSALVGRANVCSPTLSSLGTQFGLASLIRKSLAIVGDARLGGRADLGAITERLLSISGEDGITIPRKYLEDVTCTLPTRFVLLTNELPRLRDESGALASRMILLRMTESFIGRENRNLTNDLLRELPGILLWAIAGWDRLRRRGYFAEPETADDLRRELDDLTSPIGAFLRERCLVGPQYTARRAEMYASYREWASASGRQHIEDDAGFGRGLRAALPQLKTTNRRTGQGESRERHYTGVGLLN